jgi:DNA polymerase (family 10)
MLIVEAVFLARSLKEYFDQAGIKVEVAGSLRRGVSTIGDIDLLTLDERGTKHLLEYAQVARNIESGTTRTSVLLRNGVQVDIRVVKEEEYGAALLYFTGSKEHSIALRNIALDKRWKLNEYGIFDNQTGERIAGRTESEVYQKLGLEYIPPELREARGEIEAARDGTLPDLVTVNQLRGDLQVHSTWSDGSEGIEQMAVAAMRRGYEYVAFTDHSISVGVANGLNAARFEKQWKAIDELNEKLHPFRVLKGVEAEVRSDGSLDFDANFFEGFDFVGASIHQSYRQSPEKLTARALKALANPSVDVLFHPTNRLIGRREGNRIDLPAVIKAAKENGKMLEIDGTPNRLDLDEIWARRAMEEGVGLVVDSDAHSSAELGSVEYGVTVARRAWLEAENVVNTLHLDQFLKRIQR